MLSWNARAAQIQDREQPKQDDIHAVARLLVQMSEPDTHLRDRNSMELQRPDQSHKTVVSMLDALSKQSCVQLLKVILLRAPRDLC